jgi:hypothetical protein
MTATAVGSLGVPLIALLTAGGDRSAAVKGTGDGETTGTTPRDEAVGLRA